MIFLILYNYAIVLGINVKGLYLLLYSIALRTQSEVK